MSTGKIISKPIFWGGTALITFAYFSAQGAASETGVGIQNGLEIVALGFGVALIIYAVRTT